MTFWPIFAVLLSGAVKGLVSLLQPGNVRLRAGIRAGASAITLATAGFLLLGGRWAELAVSHSPADGLTKAVDWTNVSIEVTLVIIVLVSLIQLVLDIRSFLGKTTTLEVRTSRS